MLKGIYASVSAMLAGINKQALKAHNTANLDTPGFKEVFTTMQEAGKTEVFQPTGSTIGPTYDSIGHLGLGVMTTETRTKFGDGELQVTNQVLDFALQGKGFFRILTTEGERFTRDGRFSRDAEGTIVTVDGNKVLDSSGKPIKLVDGEPVIDSKGGIYINGQFIAQLGISEFTNPDSELQNEGGNLFLALGSTIQSTTNTSIHQGYLEKSNVNAVDLMIGTKSYQAAHMMVQTQDELLGKSISILGKME